MIQWVNVCNAELYFNGYVEIQSQYHAIHPFKVYNSMFFYIFENVFADRGKYNHNQF